MEYHLALAPDFDISAAEFAAAWNADPECRKLAEAAITHAAPKGFALDPGMLHDGLLVLAAFAGSIAADVLKDVIKERLKKLIDRKFPNTPQPVADVAILDQHGQPLVVVKKR